MLTTQWRVTHSKCKRSLIRINGNQLMSLNTEPSPDNKISNLSNPQFEKFATFRESKRYNSKEFQVRIRERIINHQSCQPIQEKESPKSLTIKLPKLIASNSPFKSTAQPKKEFVLNFFRKGKFLKIKKRRQATIQ